jgi:uncharacterized RDD family membrane protein YckC
MSEPFSPSADGPSGPRASFGRRLVAALVDGVILAIPYLILWAIVGQELAYALSLIVDIAYFTYLEGGPTGQTVGKRALDIRVIDFATGGSIGYGRGFIRWLGRLLSAVACLIGYLWMLWDKEKQTWHDKLANAVVVPTSAYPVG